MTTLNLDRVALLANHLARRILAACNEGSFTTEDFQDSPEIALIGEVAQAPRELVLELPPCIGRLMEAAAEQTQI